MRKFVSFPIAVFALASLTWGQQPVKIKQFKDPQNLGPDIPTPDLVVDAMLTAAKVQPGEMVYDLGCGDGRILVAAVKKFQAKAVGIELSKDIFEKTSAHIRDLGLQDQIRIIHGNALHTDLSGADVVTLYLLTSSNDMLKPSLARLHPGARVVSHDYHIPGWKPSMTAKVTVMRRPHTIYVYEIPAAR